MSPGFEAAKFYAILADAAKANDGDIQFHDARSTIKVVVASGEGGRKEKAGQWEHGCGLEIRSTTNRLDHMY